MSDSDQLFFFDAWNQADKTVAAARSLREAVLSSCGCALRSKLNARIGRT